ncbi:STAR9 protein, partial [Amia calva]|nr:STAR9 protein [Amia calva]
MDFGFDYCYWSVDPEAPNYASQEEVFQDLGTSVLAGAAKGYNVCLFAYGQTGSGKTYTMMGTPVSLGLTPRICEGLFTRDDVYPEGPNSCRVEVSFLEIYNERVRDLLKRSDQKKPFTLRVREHPEKGPYVQGLSQHVVSDYKQAVELLEEGIANRITAATHIHDASSRSHAIFTIQYTQAILENNMPSEIVSKINLVDLAGSERADPNYCRDRITEGSNINKSLVTLGIVISALAQNSQMFSSCQSINSVVSEGEGSTAGSHSSSHSGGGRRHCYIPYRDSVLTWLLKDSLGGNSKTIMVATISPSSSSYSETLSTLRYAAHARNIVNKPRVNEDASVKLIRELREEINRLKNMLLSFEMRNPSPSFSEYRDGNLSDIVLQNELKIEQLTKDWTDKWRDKQELLEQYCVDINRERARVQIDSLLPHLIAVDGDVLSTGVTFYYLQEGVTKIGPSDELKDYHIDRACCEIVNERGVVTLRPVPGNLCTINHREVTEPCRLAQGAMIVLGGAHKFRFNHPAEAAILRHRRRMDTSGVMFSLRMHVNVVNVFLPELGGGTGAHSPGSLPTRQLVEQQCYVKSLKEEIKAAQRKAERDLESEQLHLRQQHRDNQQWVLQETQRLTFEERRTRELGVQTDLVQGSGAQAQVPQGWRVWEETQGNRKKLVQEELLRHHALRRAESRVRRKRLRYQLEKIARKRHLLEAKRELQCLESALLLGRESSTSPDLHTGSRGASPILRRHSFSAELLSRLYPHHTPIYSQFLNKNKSSELAPPLGLWKPPVPRRCLSEECLPAAAARRMRDQTQTSTTRVDYQLGSNTNSVENLKELDINLGPCRRDIHPWTAKGHHRKNKRRVDRNPELQQRTPSILDQSKSKERTVSKSSKSKTRRNPSKVVKHSIKGNKGHERIKNAISQSVSPGIKTVLSRVLRKPPSGLSPKSIKKITGRLFVNLDGKAAEKCCIKMSSSCEDLEHLSEPAVDGSHPKRWHSAEVLTEGIKQASGQILSGWDESEEEGSSDSDSLYSLDSLSSAYTRALAEQLKQEDADNAGQSDGESVDSQMSQDSLVTESHRKQSERVAVPSPSQRGAGLLSNSHPAGSYLTNQERRISLDCLAEPKLSVYQQQENKDDIGKDPATAVESPCLRDYSLSSMSQKSAREEEHLLALTDAWSSTETADSPRVLPNSLVSQDAEDTLNSFPLSSPELSDSLSCTLDLDPSPTSTLGKNTTLEEQRYWDLNTSACMRTVIGRTLKEITHPLIPSSQSNIVLHNEQPASFENGGTQSCSSPVSECGSILKVVENVPFVQGSDIKSSSGTNCPKQNEKNSANEPLGKLPCSSPSMISAKNIIPGSSETVSMHHSERLHPWSQSDQLHLEPAGFSSRGVEVRSVSPSELPCRHVLVDMPSGTIDFPEERTTEKDCTAQDNHAITQPPLVSNAMCEAHTEASIKDVNIGMACLSFSEQQDNKGFPQHRHSDTDNLINISSLQCSNNANSNSNTEASLTTPKNDPNPFPGGSDKRDLMYSASYDSPETSEIPSFSEELNHGVDSTPKSENQVSPHNHPHLCSREMQQSDYPKENEMMGFKGSACGSDAAKTLEQTERIIWEGNSKEQDSSSKDITGPEEHMPHAGMEEVKVKAICKEEDEEVFKETCLDTVVTKESTEKNGANHPEEEPIDTEEHQEACKTNKPKLDSVEKMHKQCRSTYSKSVVESIDQCPSLPVNTPSQADSTVETRKCSHITSEEYSTNLNVFERETNNLNINIGIQNSQLLEEVEGNNSIVISDISKVQNVPYTCKNQHLYHDSKVLTVPVAISHISELVPDSTGNTLTQQSSGGKTHVQELNEEKGRLDSALKCDLEDVACESISASVERRQTLWTLEKTESMKGDSAADDEDRKNVTLKYSQSGPENGISTVDQKISEVVKEHMEVSMKDVSHGRLEEYKLVACMSPENNSRVGEDEGSVHGRQSSSIQFNTKGEQISNSKSPAIDRKSEPSPSGPQTNLPKQSYDQMTSEALVTDFATHPAVDACASINTNSTRALSSSHRISLLEDHKSAHECNCSGPRNKDSTDADNTRTPQMNKVGNKHKKRPKPERFDTPASSLESSSSAESILNLSLEQSLTLNRSPDRSAIALPRHRAQNHSKHNKAPHSKKECCTDLQDHRGSSPAVTGSLNAISHTLETSTHQQSSVIPAQSNREINDGSCPQKSNSKEEISAVYHSSKDQPSNPYPSHNGMGSFRQDRFQPQGGSSHLPDKKDAMHFGSSDINPYGHPWQQKEASRVVFKNQAFGSASDVSCQTISLEVGDHTVTRCCSVDNGLNIQNSPFPSHLSSFANTRGMSSTLSSIEDYQKQEPLMYQQKGRNLLNSGSCNSFCSVASGELGNSSVQVDEIVLLYSSEPESVMPPCEGPLRLTCEHSTQTLDDSRQTKKTRHRRSSTQIPVSRKEDEEIVGQQSTSWASLQNMSLHLSQLIHNTSDLLGNIQTVRAREAHHQPSTPKIFAPLLNSSRKRDSSTQTTVDVGIQTECFLKSSSRIGHKTYPVEDTKKPQEVNVIVKVIGSDILDVSQEDKDITLTLKDKGKKAAVDISNLGISRITGNSPQMSPSENQKLPREESAHHTTYRNESYKPVCLIDRASSPILTVEVGIKTCMGRSKSIQCLVNHVESHDSQELLEDSFREQRKTRSASCPRLLRESTSPLPSNGNVRLHTPPTVTERPGDGPPLASKQVDRAWGRHQQCATPESPSYYRNTLRYYQGTPEEVDNWKSHFETFEASEGTVKLQDDDTVSVAPSECNTEVLLNINPLEDSSQSPQSRQENCSVPEDLPMHNKFTNWSGVHYRPPSSLNSSSAPQTECLDQKTKKKKSGSAASSSPASRELQDNRVREIERLRKERAQVMAGIGFDLNCHQLTVELREAKLNYGLGETDALLKMLHSGAEEDTPSVPTKQQLYDRHKKSIEGLRQERETLLQSCRRARSLSPSKHPSCSGQGAGPLPRDPDTPSRRREYLQQLRQDVIDSTRVVEARRPGARCPSEIELLIRDYGRAREEAKTEIARARDRLRERTEQEKRRLQQQALSQILRDDLRFHTRISTSTLCTGSSLSLSSGPTSGYNSSNTVAPTEGTKQPLQVLGNSQTVGASEESGLKVRGRPTVWCTQGLQAKRQWLSAHDVRLEVPDSGSEAQQPPFSSRVRERTLSVSSALSVSESYQEIAACTVACAVAEIRSAAEGDLANLLAGQASSGWKYQGSEQGVQVYYKPFPSTSVHGFLGAGVIGQPLYSVWCMIRDHSKTHLYHKAIRVTQTRPLDSATQLVYLVMDTSACCLTQPRDFCCISVELKQENLFVLALRSVFDETLPRPDAEMVRGELLPSAWLLQPHSQDGKEVTHATYMTQVHRFITLIAVPTRDHFRVDGYSGWNS